MDIKNLKFELIKNDTNVQTKNEKPFAVIYSDKLFFGTLLTKTIETTFKNINFKSQILPSSIKKTFFVTISTSDNIMKIEFVDEKTKNCFEGSIFTSKDGKIVSTWVGNKSMIASIAQKMNLDMSNNKFYTSIEYSRINDCIYLEFDKNNFKYSKKEQYLKTQNKIKWNRDNKEYELSNLICYVNSQFRSKNNFNSLIELMGFKKKKDYYLALGEIFSKTGDRSLGYPVQQIINSFVKWEYHYIYTYTKGKHGLANGGRDEFYINKFIKKYSSMNLRDLVKVIKKIIEEKDLKIK